MRSSLSPRLPGDISPPSSPPPRATVNTAPLTIPDPRNTILRPQGTQYQLLLSEGAYTFRDEISLGSIPAHPSETGVPAPNVLDTKSVPPTAGTRLTIAILAPRRPPSQSRHLPATPSSNSKSSLTENSHESSQNNGDLNSTRFPGLGVLPGFRSKIGDGDGTVGQPNGKDTKDPLKRKKPKNNITKSSSSFISRAIPNEALAKRVNEHPLDGYYAIANINRALLWLDLSSSNKQDQMMKILLTKAHALCHDFNEYSKTPSHMDIIMGFSTSEILWYEPISQRYTRLNKNGVVNSSPITEIKWLPNSENLFLAAHSDGSIVIYDKEREDAAVVFEDENQAPPRVSRDGKRLPRLLVRKSMQSKNQKTNPVSVWKTTNQRINGLEFSPDGKLLAVASEDGSLRILEWERELLLDQYSSYYGGLTCLAWSPDGAYLATGGQDDLISIWSVYERDLVARCVGHRSWISKVSFDAWRCDGITYRFGSVGEDGRLLLWDFSVGTLNRPRVASIRQSISSFVPPGGDRSNSTATITPRMPESKSPRRSVDEEDRPLHPILPRSQVAMLPPVLSKEVDVHALSWIRFEEDCIIAACRAGHIRTWDRPKEEEPGETTNSTAHAFTNPFIQEP